MRKQRREEKKGKRKRERTAFEVAGCSVHGDSVIRFSDIICFYTKVVS